MNRLMPSGLPAWSSIKKHFGQFHEHLPAVLGVPSNQLSLQNSTSFAVLTMNGDS